MRSLELADTSQHALDRSRENMMMPDGRCGHIQYGSVGSFSHYSALALTKDSSNNFKLDATPNGIKGNLGNSINKCNLCLGLNRSTLI